jgi:uncharacterized protein (UPF0147 family)
VDGLLEQQLCEEESLVFAAKDVRREVQKEIKNLESGDQVVAIKAAAALVMLARLPDATPFLPAAIKRLIPFLHDSTLSVHLQVHPSLSFGLRWLCQCKLYACLFGVLGNHGSTLSLSLLPH